MKDHEKAQLINTHVLASQLRDISNNAYVQYAKLMASQPCVGVERKLASGEFTLDNLRVFMQAPEWLGRHRALYNAAEMVAIAASSIFTKAVESNR
jgi:hypothetical protein